MPPLSAVDAIQPAWTHTRLLLWGRRDTRLLFKLAAVAFFAEVGSGFSSSLRAPGRVGHGLPAGLNLAWMPLLIAFVGLGLVIGLLLFYVSSRLQFVLFHTVLRGEVEIAPIWRRYGPATWQWIGLKLLFFLAIALCMLPVALPAVLVFVRSMPKQAGGHPALGSLFASLFGVLAAILLILLLAAIAYVLLRDFGLPSMALEGTPLRETLRRVVALVRVQPGPVAFYLLMRFVLALAGTFTSYAVLIIVGLVAALPLGGAGFALWAGLHESSSSAHVLMVAGWVLLGLLMAALLLVAGILLFGYVFTFLQAYATFFLAGRYPFLAMQLVSLAPPSGAAYPFTPGSYAPAVSGVGSQGPAAQYPEWHHPPHSPSA